jgi:phosphatidate cytidylyltransferase
MSNRVRMDPEFRLRLLTGAGIVACIVMCILGGGTSWSVLLALLVLQGWREARSAFALACPHWGVALGALLAVVVVIVPAAGLWGLGWYQGDYTSATLIGWFVLVWANDSFAYLVGRRWGKTRIAPTVSPGKTWDGWFGGMVATVLLGALVLAPAIGSSGPSAMTWGVLALIVSVLGPVGDLSESALKRQAGLKDSGTILPGHGGVLDRFDSHFISAPIAAILLQLF